MGNEYKEKLLILQGKMEKIQIKNTVKYTCTSIQFAKITDSLQNKMQKHTIGSYYFQIGKKKKNHFGKEVEKNLV